MWGSNPGIGKRLMFSEPARTAEVSRPRRTGERRSVAGVRGRVPEMRAKPVTARKNKQSLPRRKGETETLLTRLNQRLISDFEMETQDFAFLCLLASASKLSRLPEGGDDPGEEAPYLTFH